jgi:alpha-D-ribose 1-methylphosphonate 5-triphosphate synthase subunit PhnG
MTELEQSNARRRGWLAVLARASRDELERAAEHAGPLPTPQPVRRAESGMIMLRGRVGGTGDAFNLGEASVTRSALRVGEYLGLGYVLGRDRRKSELVALFDALLQDAARQSALLRDVVEPLARAQQDLRARASREAAASRVEFFTMVRGET